MAGYIFLMGLIMFIMVRVLPGDRTIMNSKRITPGLANIRGWYWIMFGVSFLFVIAFVIDSLDLYDYIPSFLLIQ